jgi:peroxiredoxin
MHDASVMSAWGKDQKTEGKVTMLADGSGDFARALGLELDLTHAGLGIRSQRYSMVIDNGVVQSFFVEPAPGQVDASHAAAMVMNLEGDRSVVRMGLEGNPRDRKGSPA